MTEPHLCPFCKQDPVVLFCAACHTTFCSRDSQKHLYCGYLLSIETVTKAITSKINYLEILSALLSHAIGDTPPQETTATMQQCKTELSRIQHISRHKLKHGHI
jgi:hypothetical protein